MSYSLVGGQLQHDHDPNDIERYGVDVRDRLAQGDSVAGVTIAAQVGITADQPTVAGTAVSARVTGGTVGQPASMTLRYTTALGTSRDVTINFRVVQR